jgi:hypothetical protein
LILIELKMSTNKPKQMQINPAEVKPAKPSFAQPKPKINHLQQKAITNNGEGLNINALLKAKDLPDHHNQSSDGGNGQASLYNNAMPYSEGKAMAQAALEQQLSMGFSPIPGEPSPFPSSYEYGDEDQAKKRKK